MQNAIKKLRKKAGMTQGALANAINATRRQVGAWERGENDLPLDFADAMADIFECSLDEIAGRETNDDTEQELLKLYRSITDEGRYRLMIYARGLFYTYRKDKNKENENTSIW